jgi:cell division protein FtsQ
VSARASAAAASTVSDTVDAAGARRRSGWRRRRGNRRLTVKHTPVLLAVAGGVGALGRGLLVACRLTAKLLVVAGLGAALVIGGRLGARHVMGSPRFALREVTVTPTTRMSREELLELAGVHEGDRLLALDTDAVAARVAAHPWIAEARVHRELPSGLRLEVVERHAAAVVALGALYLVDESGRPFKRATMEEADGLPVITGVERAVYVDARAAGEAAFREALALTAAWRARRSLPPLSEVNIEPRHGFTVFLLESGAEIRLGRGDYERKLGSFERMRPCAVPPASTSARASSRERLARPTHTSRGRFAGSFRGPSRAIGIAPTTADSAELPAEFPHPFFDQKARRLSRRM